jgi:hypothetical protein
MPAVIFSCLLATSLPSAAPYASIAAQKTVIPIESVERTLDEVVPDS